MAKNNVSTNNDTLINELKEKIVHLTKQNEENNMLKDQMMKQKQISDAEHRKQLDEINIKIGDEMMKQKENSDAELRKQVDEMNIKISDLTREHEEMNSSNIEMKNQKEKSDV